MAYVKCVFQERRECIYNTFYCNRQNIMYNKKKESCRQLQLVSILRILTLINKGMCSDPIRLPRFARNDKREENKP